LVTAAVTGLAPGASLSITQLNDFANLADEMFLWRWGGTFGITVARFATEVNTKAAIAGSVYTEVAKLADFLAPPDLQTRKGRLMYEQGWLLQGGARIGPLITFLDVTPTLTADAIADHLDTGLISTFSPTLFPAAAGLTSGRIRLALAWLRKDPANPDVRAFLDAQVSTVGGVNTLSATVRAELGGMTEDEVLEALGRLTPTTTTIGPGGRVVTLEPANAQLGRGAMNRIRIEPQEYEATVLPYALNVRRGPSMAYPPFFWVHRGDTVRVMGFTHDWAAIDANGKLGFVYRTQISPP
jgi:hypothetical protein